MGKPESLICDVLLDQEIFSGSGNNTKDEVLYRQQVHPESKVKAIPDVKLEMIVSEIRKFSLEYLAALKEEKVINLIKVHQKKLCPVHGILLLIKVTGRLKRKSYFCKVCQKLYD